MKPHNEDTRVKIPTILHLMRLGYTYLSLKGDEAKGIAKPVWDKSNNIFTDIFNESLSKLNPSINEHDVKQCYDELALCLENKDLGKAFYEKLISRSGIRLIDFENFNNNQFHVVTELTCKNGEDEFRPDITLLINGLPLVFIEVKKPNNLGGTLEEKNRLEVRQSNPSFRTFFNITQLMLFSNNMPYEENTIKPVQGAFYAASSYSKTHFNYFREEDSFNLNELLVSLTDEQENQVLFDNNLISIKSEKEFTENKKPTTHTHQICTSMLQRERLAFLLEYGFAYVKGEQSLEKHIVRYPQLFATKAIESTLEQGNKKGIIWHTQGSGKTALSYFNVRYLTDYLKRKGKVAKFYFIVDRISLLIQADKEFKARGLTVHKINSREDFSKDIKSPVAIHNDSGKSEITVVNIQKFEDDPNVIKLNDYNVNIQRVFFLDEVHRSYNPKGSFLANLEQADRSSIKIGLTGTPYLGEQYSSKSLFNGYIHKYYYNRSIQDGYTLRLLREQIETQYKLQLQQTLEEIEVLQGKTSKEEVYAHEKFVEPMLDYIVKDFEKFRIIKGDNAIGAMVICDSSKQAREMNKIFQEQYAKDKTEEAQNAYLEVAEPQTTYNQKKKASSKVDTAALILFDAGTKKERKDLVEDFKDGNIDLLFVYDMLLTGFDAPRLKKLYLGRKLKAHNLLQALTRVNRRYKEFDYGNVVDFADIEKEFEQTNKDYFKELQSELGDEIENYSSLFKTSEEITQEVADIKAALCYYELGNKEVFSQQMTEINNRDELLKITKALNDAKSLYNVIRLSGEYKLLTELDFNILKVHASEAEKRLAQIRLVERINDDSVDSKSLLNEALEDALFSFTKIKEEELKLLADDIKDNLRKTRQTLANNFDPNSPVVVSLKEELERLFKKKKLTEVSKEQLEANIELLDKLYNQAKAEERHNNLLLAKYHQDQKYVRLHKRLIEKNFLTDNEIKLFETLNGLKVCVDNLVSKAEKQLENSDYISDMIAPLIFEEFEDKRDIELDIEEAKMIQHMLVKEYVIEYRNVSPF